MFLGISIGAMGAKAAVVDVDGVIAGQGAAWNHFGQPKPLLGGHDPEVWWRAADAAVLAIDRHVRGLVRGIGLAGRMHSVAVLGADDMPLRREDPGPPEGSVGFAQGDPGWQTLRTEPRAICTEGLAAMLGRIGAVGSATNGTIRTVLLPKDFLRMRLTGDKASEMSGAAATMCLNVAERSWSTRLLEEAGLAKAQMPRLLEGAEVTGHLREKVASRWGMRQVLVAGGGADAAAASVGLGAVRDGEAILSLDGSVSILVTMSSHRPVAGETLLRSCYALPETWGVGSACYERRDWSDGLVTHDETRQLFASAHSDSFRDNPTRDEDDLRSGLGALDARFGGPSANARMVDAACGPPALDGERLAEALRTAMHALRSSGVHVDSLSVSGSALMLCRWGNALANALDAELVYRRDSAVARVVGAARLAQLAIDGGSPDDVCAVPPAIEVLRPSPDRVSRANMNR